MIVRHFENREGLGGRFTELQNIVAWRLRSTAGAETPNKQI